MVVGACLLARHPGSATLAHQQYRPRLTNCRTIVSPTQAGVGHDGPGGPSKVASVVQGAGCSECASLSHLCPWRPRSAAVRYKGEQEGGGGVNPSARRPRARSRGQQH